MRKLTFGLLSLTTLSLCSCTTYASHYRAIILITNNSNTESSMRFGEFEGTYVFKMKKTSAGEGCIVYHASLEQGFFNVSYVISGREAPLFTISSGQTLDEQAGYIEKGQKVTIVVSSDGHASNGEFIFKFSN